MIAGKTGTAEFGVRDAQGRLPFHNWFVGFLPLRGDVSRPDSQLAVVGFNEDANTVGNSATEMVKYFLQIHLGTHHDLRRYGTASRETDRLAADLIKRHPDLNLTKAVVSEAGASASTPPRPTPRRNCPAWTSRCAARCRSRGGCRTRWPNWSRSTPSPSASASTSTTWPRASCRTRWTPWSRTA